MSCSFRRSLGMFACLMFSLAGCSDATALLVEVTSQDLRVPEDIDALRFEVFDEMGAMADRSVMLPGTWPQSLAITPGASSLEGNVIVRVTGSLRGVSRVRRVVQTRFAEGRTVEVNVSLAAACVGVTCANEFADCIQGRCEDSQPPADAGPDMMLPDMGLPDGPLTDVTVPDMNVPDEGTPDMNVPDIGTPDMSVPDMSVPDMSVPDMNVPDMNVPDLPCVPEPEVCDGQSQDCDAAIDEGIPCAGTLLISEVTTGGPGGGSDEFLEIYNTTAAPIALSGVTIGYKSSNGASFGTRTTFGPGDTIPAHGFFLSGSNNYSRGATPDKPNAWSTGFANGGGHVRLEYQGLDLDVFAWGSASMPDGAAIMNFNASAESGGATYERKANAASTETTMTSGADATAGNGHDTNNNAADFIVRTVGNPQNRSSAPEVP